MYNVLLVKQELLSNLLEHPGSVACLVDRCLSFFLSIVLSVLLRFTDSDCPFDIVQLFFIRESYWTLLRQELLIFPGHTSSLSVFREVRVAQSLVFCVVFSRSLFVLFLLVIVFCLSSTCGFWLTFSYLQYFIFYKNIP